MTHYLAVCIFSMLLSYNTDLGLDAGLSQQATINMVGSISLPLPKIECQDLPVGFSVIKQHDDQSVIICKNPFDHLVPDYSDPEHQKFILWAARRTGKNPELKMWPIKKDTEEIGVPRVVSMAAELPVVNNSSEMKLTEEQVNKIAKARDAYWKKALSNSIPELSGTPDESPESIAEFIRGVINDRQQKRK